MDSCCNHRLRNFLLCSLSILMVLLSTDLSIAKQVTFERDYTYQASEYDSKVSCRVNALEQVKRLLLEELGTYLESRTEVRDFKLTKDQIITLTAGIVRTEIVKETWDGKTFWLKARIEADPDEVIKSVDSLRKDHQKTKELEETRRKAAEYLKEMERLKIELALAKGDIKKQGQYNEAVKGLSATDWIEKGNAYLMPGKDQDAINAYTIAIALDPKYVKAYKNRGVVYLKLGNYQQAIADFTRAIELDPKDAPAFRHLGICYEALGEYQKAIYSFSKAIETNSDPLTEYYSCRGEAYYEVGEYQLALYDLNESMGLRPPTKPYWRSHRYRGLSYIKLGNTRKGFEDLKLSAQWGDEWSQDFLRKLGIEW